MTAVLIVIALLIGAPPSCYRPPVDAPVIDGFRPPACPWCPGNRGLEYATVPGDAVHAAASGEVAFAGAVAGSRYVVVAGDDGRRLTYGRLVRIHVVVGDRVEPGQRLASADASFHFGVRVGDRYIDPAGLLGRWRTRPRLVPVDGAPRRPGRGATLSCPPSTVVGEPLRRRGSISGRPGSDRAHAAARADTDNDARPRPAVAPAPG